MQQTNLIVSTVNGSGKKENTTISYVNNSITNAKAIELAQAISGLMKNTYSGVKKTTSEEVLD